MTDLVLVRPGISNKAEQHWSFAPPLGLGYLASIARANGLDVRVVDGKLSEHDSPTATADAIIAYKPKFVGISAMTPEYPAARNIARKIKASGNGPVTILGGAHANALPEQVVAEAPEFDYVYAGDGERLFVNGDLAALLRGELTDPVPGLFSQNDGRNIAHSIAVHDFDITHKIFPAWDLFPRAKIYPILTERGCPYKCVFCSRNSSSKIRTRPIEHVIEEIEWLHRNFKPEAIHFEDETFGLNNQRLEPLLVWLEKFNRRAGISFKAQTRVDRVSKSFLQLMKAAGFGYVEFGVESCDPGVMKRSGKNITREQVATAVKLARQAGLKIWLKFIIGLPGETGATIRNTINFAARLNPDRISVATIVAYPGSEIYTWARSGQNGYRLFSDDWSSFDKYISNSVELDNMSAGTMRRYQMQMYLETYARNLRFVELFNLFYKHKYFFRPWLKGLIGKKRK